MIVTSPNVRYNGTIGGDVFVEGVCRNPSQANLWYYKAQGFGIGESEIEVPQAEKNAEPELTVQARPEPRAKKSEWQAYAATLGLDPSGMTTEQIVAMVDAFEADGQE
mgnify:CR=1 FL=1